MIKTETFFQHLETLGINFFTGVPDSLLKSFCAFLSDHIPQNKHVIAVNEGAAVGLAMGSHLATGKVPLVYMQNSGIGNAINPLMSLADPQVYAIPMLLMIGWRGEPGVKDEPQHIKQGRVLLDSLDAMEVPYLVIDGSCQKALASIFEKIASHFRENQSPFALVVRKDTFSSYQLQNSTQNSFSLSREEAIATLLNHLDESDVIVSTTGMASRELFELRQQRNQLHDNDFLTVGGMGHASQIAQGIALNAPQKRVICVDGDGACLMHLGAMASNGTIATQNFYHVILNNGAHDSVGGQPTIGFNIDFNLIARGCGYPNYFSADTEEELNRVLTSFFSQKGPVLLEIKVKKGARPDLGRPTTKPVDNKIAFMKKLTG